MEQLSVSSSKPPERGRGGITILLLGETGVGKSTWVNGFANFLQYETLDEAESNPTLCVIPSSFTMTDDNYEERLISTGDDKNEVMEAGQSATQHPQSYTFPNDEYVVRLIDTPGIGDVRGVEQDKKNFEMILDHISHLDDLHAICILLKPNNARLNIMFSFCIKELLTHLHKDACRNIVFCFTNSRSTFYRPGDTLPALRKLLEENKDVQIALNQSTLYCMDNESIRFLYALKDGIKFTPEERKNYISSWDKSVAEVTRLLKHASEQRPHPIQHTLSLNNARQTVLALGNPMAEISRNIQLNIAYKENQKHELLNSKLSKEELSNNLITHEFSVRTKMLHEPRTICTAAKCVEYVNVGGRVEINYKTFCHEGCGQGKQKHFKIVNIVGHKDLRKCSAFDRKGHCKHCGCLWKTHMKIAHETFTERKEIIDIAKKLEIEEKTTAISKIEKFLDAVDEYLLELKKEQEEITKASLEFARFLKTNAITPYNDSMDAYLMHFINEEKGKVAQGGDPKALQAMEQMRMNYKQEMDILETAMKEGKTDERISAEDLEKCVQNLYHLKHSGQKLMDMMNTSLHSASSNYVEKRIERTPSSMTTTTKIVKLEKNKKPGILSEIKDAFRMPHSSGEANKKSQKYRQNSSNTTSSSNPKIGIVGKQSAAFENKAVSPPHPYGKTGHKSTAVLGGQNSNAASTSLPNSNKSRAPAPPLPPLSSKPVAGTPPKPIPNANNAVWRATPAPKPPPNANNNNSGWTATPAPKPLPNSTNAGPTANPPAPRAPPAPPIPVDQLPTKLPLVSDERSSLLSQIREGKQLKKTDGKIGSNADQSGTTRPTSGNGVNEALLRALGERAKRFQISVDGDSDPDDGEFN